MTTEISSYKDFFRTAFRNEPFDYQERLADKNLAFPSLLNAPTGAGKTNAVLGAWMWLRLNNSEDIGRRLIYCLPMRTLVEQTRSVAESAIKNLADAGATVNGKEITLETFPVHTLYGGDVSDDWDIYPEREQIIIGTQDLLLSRALNRGYAMNRFRWAFHFGLFNNDCLWVFDEVQLFGDGLATTAQLAAMREKFTTFGTAKSLWMSATLDKDWLKTVDFTPQDEEFQLQEADYENPQLKQRLTAVKNLQKAKVECRLPKGLADFVVQKHQPGTQTLIVVNTVARAQEVYAEIEKNYALAKKRDQKPSELALSENENQPPEIHLLHSRFRPAERRKWQEIFNKDIDTASGGRIIIATQVIEAGVDISAKLLLTDIAPVPSLVQRFGRVNRKGEFDSSEIYWIDLPLLTKHRDKFGAIDLSKLDDKALGEISKTVKPYEWENIAKSKAILETINSASPNDLRGIEYKEIYTPTHVLRQRDLVDLFDTTADLSGFDLDVSRFVRGGKERDVSVYWRENVEEEIKPLKGTKKEKRDLKKKFAPHREELCSVPIYDAATFIDKVKKAWTFDALSGEWREIRKDNLRTGMIILLDAKNGGYDEIGWNPKSKKVKVFSPSSKKDENENLIDESYPDDVLTFEPSPLNKFLHYAQTLKAHSLEVRAAAEQILDDLKLPQLVEFAGQVISAAHHHDLGKAHPVFQATVHKIDKAISPEKYDFSEVLAKAKSGGKHRRSKFRHELASALALLQRNRDLPENEKHSDLEIYLVAAHHGKVRLSIRALPDETKPFELDENGKYKPLNKRYARGIWEGDELPATDLGNDEVFPAVTLNLEALSLGRNADNEPSWLERMINLRIKYGVFRLAYLEAIIRAADVQASANPKDILPETEASADEQNSLEVNENDK